MYVINLSNTHHLHDRLHTNHLVRQQRIHICRYVWKLILVVCCADDGDDDDNNNGGDGGGGFFVVMVSDHMFLVKFFGLTSI